MIYKQNLENDIIKAIFAIKPIYLRKELDIYYSGNWRNRLQRESMAELIVIDKE